MNPASPIIRTGDVLQGGWIVEAVAQSRPATQAHSVHATLLSVHRPIGRFSFLAVVHGVDEFGVLVSIGPKLGLVGQDHFAAVLTW